MNMSEWIGGDACGEVLASVLLASAATVVVKIDAGHDVHGGDLARGGSSTFMLGAVGCGACPDVVTADRADFLCRGGGHFDLPCGGGGCHAVKIRHEYPGVKSN